MLYINQSVALLPVGVCILASADTNIRAHSMAPYDHELHTPSTGHMTMLVLLAISVCLLVLLSCWLTKRRTGMVDKQTEDLKNQLASWGVCSYNTYQYLSFPLTCI